MRTDLAWLLPAAVDGAMAVGAVAAVVVRRLQRSTVRPWTVVLVNTAISVTCNGLHAYKGGSTMALPTVVAVVVSAVPAVNLALSVHLLVVLVDVLTDALMERGTGSMSSTAEDGKCTVRVREWPGGGGSTAALDHGHCLHLHVLQMRQEQIQQFEAAGFPARRIVQHNDPSRPLVRSCSWRARSLRSGRPHARPVLNRDHSDEQPK